MTEPELAERLARRAGLVVARAGPDFRVGQRRRLGGRGLLRLLWPAAQARVRLQAGNPRISVMPDGWAWLTWIILFGAAAVELLMDRAQYPRDYPQVLPFAALGLYSLLMLAAVISLSSTLKRAVSA